MNKLTVAIFSFFLLGSLGACDTSDDSVDDSSDASTTESPDVDASPSPQSDAAPSTPVADAGSGSGQGTGVAGEVGCGEDTCSLTSGDICCISISGSTCVPDDECGGGFSAPQYCDGPEDCSSGQACCAVFSFGGDIGSFCRDDCSTSEAGDEAELCHSNDDCSDSSEECRSCQFQGAPSAQNACAGDDIPACQN